MPRDGRHALQILGIMLVVMLGIGGVAWWQTKTSKTDLYVNMCQNLVKEKLRSPGSAQFSEVVAIETAPLTWSVTGVVDSQNGFGALLRSSWSCAGSSGSWEVEVTPR